MPNERWARGIILAAATLWVIFVLVAGGQVDFGWYRWLGASISIIVYGLWFFDRWAWRWRGVQTASSSARASRHMARATVPRRKDDESSCLREYGLEEHRCVETRQKTGNVVLSLNGGPR